MRTIVSLLALAYAASTGSAAAQTLNFSSSQISTPAAFEGYAQGGAWGDFNGDGKSDLAIVTNGGSDHPQVLVILLGNGDGTFQPGVVYPLTGRTPQTVVVADFNGDGKQDLAVPCFSGGAGVPGEISLFLGKGDGTFQSAVSITVGNQAGWLAVGRFNNDAKLDMAVPNPNSNQIEVLLGNTNGTFQPAVIYPVGKGTQLDRRRGFERRWETGPGDGKLWHQRCVGVARERRWNVRSRGEFPGRIRPLFRRNRRH